LHAGWEAAASGHGQLFLIAGEPGIGKTRLLEEFAVVVRQHGAQVLWGHCWEGAGAPALWPWTQILRSHRQQTDMALLKEDLGTDAAAIAQVFGEIWEHQPTFPALPEVNAEHARFRFFDSFTLFLKAVATRCPLLLILDDLHWADTPSLSLLQFLVHQLHDARILVLGTYRDTDLNHTHPLSDTLGTLARDSRRLELPGLSAEEVGRFIADTTDSTPSTSLVTTVYERTSGNPFFIHETVRLLHVEGGLTEPASWSSSIPSGVKETIRRRLAQLSTEPGGVLSSAAVIGREFSTALLSQLRQVYAQERPEAIFAALHEAENARIIAKVPGLYDCYRFTHVLIRDTLYEDLPLPDRVQVHRQIGETIERLCAADLQSHLPELADHFFRAAPSGTREQAFHYAIQAGTRATSLFAYEEAAGYYERALQLLPHVEAGLTQHCELLLALGEARYHAGQTQVARETFLQAAELAQQLQSSDDPQALVRLQDKIQTLKSKILTENPEFQGPNLGSQDNLTKRPSQDSGLRTQDSGPRAQDSNLFRREGDYWTLRYHGESARVRDVKGLHHLVSLLREPGREFHVVDLLAMTDAPPLGPSSPRKEARGLVPLLSPERTLPDQKARVLYRQRLRELREELAEAEQFHDNGRVDTLREEMEFLTQELMGAYGVCQSQRKSSGEIEKARKAVAYRIRTALTKIRHTHAPLGRHLAAAIRTGVFCSYNPEQPTPWSLEG
jgi:hypothetical protein